MLTEKSIEGVKQITPLVAANAESITRRFYERMFEGDPEVRVFFNHAHQVTGDQQSALAGAICAYFENIDNLEVLVSAIEVIAQKHCSLNIQPEHYPIVGKHLLAAIKDVVEEPVTEEIEVAVTEAYGHLADLCIQREKEIYAAQASSPGGWNGFRPFRVARKVQESDLVTSLHLVPVDGKQIPNFMPGQYITIQVDHPVSTTSPRNYSLSDRPGKDSFRISVKLESSSMPETPDGLISTFLHNHVREGDVLNVGPPCGEFIVDVNELDDRPVVFLAGGIGVTPLLAMAKTLVHESVPGRIQFFHASRNSAVHAFRDEVQKMVSDKDFVETYFIYDEPLQADIDRGCFDFEGTVSTEMLRDRTPYREAEFYVCGPGPFMSSVLSSLQELGVENSKVHFEFFGPRQAIAPQQDPATSANS